MGSFNAMDLQKAKNLYENLLKSGRNSNKNIGSLENDEKEGLTINFTTPKKCSIDVMDFKPPVKIYFSQANSTSVPYFDINYDLILEDMPKNERYDYLQNDMTILYTLFGYRKGPNFLSDITNQSFVGLEYVFPSIMSNSTPLYIKQKESRTTEIENLFSKATNSDICTEKVADPLVRNKFTEILYIPRLKYYDEYFHKNVDLKADSRILDFETFNTIGKYLPNSMNGSPLYLYYEPSKDGLSYNALYRNCYNQNDLIIIVKTTKGRVFGSFMCGNLLKGEHFFGTGETFLFKKGICDLVVFKSTMKNEYYVHCDEDGIGFGAEEFHG